MIIDFHGMYEKEHVFNALRALTEATKKKNYFAKGLYVIYLSGYIIFGILYLQGKTSATISSSRMIRMSITLIFLTYFIFQHKINYWFKANYLWKGLKDKSAVNGTIDDLGITLISSEGMEFQFLWKIFIKKVLLSDVLVLLDADGTVTILQKNFFESDKDWRRANDMVEYKVKEIIS